MKKKLLDRYPNLVFHQPIKQTQSEIVLVDSINPGPLLEYFQLSSPSNTTSTNSENEFNEGSSTSGISESKTDLSIIFNAARTLKTE